MDVGKSPYTVKHFVELLDVQWKRIKPAELPPSELTKYFCHPQRCTITERLIGLSKLKDLYTSIHNCADLRELEGDDCFEKLGIPESAMAAKMIKRKAYHLARLLRNEASAILKCAEEYWGPDGVSVAGEDLETKRMNAFDLRFSDKVYTKAFGIAQKAEKELHFFDAVMTKIYHDYRRVYCLATGVRDPVKKTVLEVKAF